MRGDTMKREEKLEMLQNLDEETLTKKFLIPLFSEGRGCKNVQYNHGTLEFGKDIIYYKEDEFDIRKYIGVQVKAEKITTSDTDTIIRQITGAFGKPFTDLGDGKQKELSGVVLITSHEFTEEAKEYLWSSLKTSNLHRNITFINGNKLVDLLDTYLPSAFWDQYNYFNRYFSAMKKEFEAIKDVSAIGQKEPIPLKDIYVSLKLSETFKREIPHTAEPERKIKKEMIEEEMEREYSVIEEEKSKKEKIFDADDAEKKFNKLVITGAPGSGKTTFLKHIALKSCLENMAKQERVAVPILVVLKEFFESQKPLRSYIDDVFEQFDFPEASDFIEKDLKEGTCQILLDGFDELASLERQQKVTKKIDEFIQKYSKNKFIVTSRKKGYHGELKGFQKLELMEFNDEQIEKFINNWFKKTASWKVAPMNI
jgi:predicted NACHT family NTPase